METWRRTTIAENAGKKRSQLGRLELGIVIAAKVTARILSVMISNARIHAPLERPNPCEPDPGTKRQENAPQHCRLASASLLVFSFFIDFLQ